jgi:hypothetical protein
MSGDGFTVDTRALQALAGDLEVEVRFTTFHVYGAEDDEPD